MALSIRLLGGLSVSRDGVALPLPGQRQRCLLAVLLLHHGRTLSRANLAAWAWPEDPPATVDRQIANYVSGLRRTLAPLGETVTLSSRSARFGAVLQADVLDVDRFGSLVENARTARAGHEHEIAAAHLHQALALWRDPPLDGLDTPYLRDRAAQLTLRHRDAVLLLARIEEEAGRLPAVLEPLRGLAAQRPQDEGVAVALVRALAACGEGVEAAEAAARATAALIADGHTPGPALRQAHSDALAGRATAPERRPEAAGSGRRGGPGPDNRRGPGPSPRQLPPDTGAFTGRSDEVARVVRLAERSGDGARAAVPAVCAIDGMGGVGKTSLALHCAHRLADRYPDGQLCLELHTHSAGVPPRGTAEALGLALSCLGFPPHAIPPGPDARAAAYRAALAGTRTLIVLDDVADEAQVRALLPGSAGCLVLVTSRRRLNGLDEADPLSLESLPAPDAMALFRATAGRELRTAEEALLAETVELCGRLPLAVRIAASLLRHRRAWRLGDVLAELHTRQGDLEAFDDGSRNLAATFELSYRSLTPDQRTLFRRLGLVPGPDIDVHGAAALLAVPPGPVRRGLRELADRHLLAETAPDRFRLHDLLRDYARGRSRAEDDPAVCEAALDGLFDHYERAARAAGHRLRMVPGGEPPEARRSWAGGPEAADFGTGGPEAGGPEAGGPEAGGPVRSSAPARTRKPGWPQRSRTWSRRPGTPRPGKIRDTPSASRSPSRPTCTTTVPGPARWSC
ncbi:AfsR/SARP family transcriptional regulator [Streptacidiphilus jiangxiensis]|uniref:DNA-binding transcriptional activator of the SARP family n=1 Tax=Streptacidiphilus jiangxiensis TaxID=235985 RepID=A0A1H8A0U2_STRJI|nr:BTAD domain-containing putative transcriptional regulator [Streptacidiphilus jiangxiensis]SEM63409.1 DNA-binding transcriptional activator of the SARP family [Streptacidiphilus jiangxiensis]